MFQNLGQILCTWTAKTQKPNQPTNQKLNQTNKHKSQTNKHKNKPQEKQPKKSL